MLGEQRRKTHVYNHTAKLGDKQEPSDAAALRDPFFPSCQVRVVLFYVSPASFSFSFSSASSAGPQHDHPQPVFLAGAQPRPSTPSVPRRTSTTTIHAQCSLPDLNHSTQPQTHITANTQPQTQHTTTAHKSKTTILRTMATCSSLWHQNKGSLRVK